MYRCYDMTLSETWLDETVTDLEMCPVGYMIYLLIEEIQIKEEVVLLLFYPATFIVVFALIHPKGILSHYRYSFIM